MAACGPAADPETLPAQPALFTEEMPKAAREHIRELRERVDQRPLSAPRNGKLGMALQSYGLDAQAAVYYQRAHLIDPSEFRWAFYLGMTLELTGDASGAIAAYLAANKLDPGELTTRRRLGEQLMLLNRLDESEQVLTQSLAIAPNDVQTLISYGRLRLRQQRHAEARKVFEQAIAVGDPSGQVYQGLAATARGLGEADEAERNLQKYAKYKNKYAFADPLLIAIGAANRSHHAHEERAKQYLDRRQPESAMREYQAALEKEPTSLVSRIAIMRLLGAQGDLKSARRVFSDGKELQPDSAALYYSFAMIQISAGNAVEAIKLLKEVIRRDPENSRARIQLGSLLERDKQLGQKAEMQYRAVLRYDPENADAHYMLGRRHLARLDKKAAMHSFQRASAKDRQKTPLYLRALAGTQASLGDYSSAETAYTRAFKLLEEYPNEKLRRELEADHKRLLAMKRQSFSK